MIPRAALLTTLMLSAVALGQEAREIALQEIDRNCRDWAEQDQVEESELASYLSDCRRLEAESYGLLETEEPMQAEENEERDLGESPDSDS